ncbi:52 kDa repressor of the inhibitor of the protein kinase [Geodia barretti]|uniref:52 kDa repressor of the inhibitor of the protein kinase n=1 Tax=Geodia barretti TaxID=519541 RepID=A0AA35TFW6_GEOBA|nr:52 kDa repressor of the inhibitor of the protein kinase [Geodia barretti]
MINIVADQVRSKIVGKIEAAKWYTVISDEVTDASNKEKLSLVLRYVDSDTLLVREDLIGFVEYNTGITGRELANKITSSLQAFGLDLSNLRGQAYDGAGNMAGSVNGTAALISAQYPLALYLHCLTLSESSCCQVIADYQCSKYDGCNRKGLPIFSVHPKRQTALEKAISDTQPTSKVHKLKDMCRTRWVQRVDAIQVFKSLHQCTVTCMEGICNDGPRLWSPDALTDARSHN